MKFNNAYSQMFPGYPDAVSLQQAAEMLGLNRHTVGELIRSRRLFALKIGRTLHHFLERGAVEDDAAVSVVDLFGNDLNIRVALHKVFNELALIGNAVALAGMIVGVGQADISGSFVFRHEKALLSPGLLPHEKSGYLAIWFSSFSTPIITLSAEKSEDVA